ncbi:hypothetical protein SDC9_152043 [bioreactor metagenome]|uniref:Uncharacterized protein n=1 Tax=bioreactor metagenome TaxID=1076179 RepID=A0A645ERZ5_9ZZZZ
MEPQIHKQQGHKRVQTGALADDAGLQYVAHHRNCQIQQQYARAPGHIPARQGQDSPGNKDGARAHHRQNVHHGDERGQQHRVFHPHEGKAKGQLAEGDKHNQQIGLDHLKQGAGEGGPRIPGQGVVFFGHLLP